MFPLRESRLSIVFLGIFFLAAIGYALFEARGQLLGPTITLAPYESVAYQSFMTVKGSVARISSLTMNGSEVQVTENGSFEEPYLLAAGYNRIVLDAKDAYGRSSQRVLEIMYIPEHTATVATSTPTAATSTPPIESSPPSLQTEPPTTSSSLPETPPAPTSSPTTAASTASTTTP